MMPAATTTSSETSTRDATVFEAPGPFGIAWYDATHDRFSATVYNAAHEVTFESGPLWLLESDARVDLRARKVDDLRSDPDAPPSKYETKFAVHVDSLNAVFDKCAALGLDVDISDVPLSQVFRSGSWSHVEWPKYHSDTSYRAKIDERAQAQADQHQNVAIRAPVATKRVVGVAKLIGDVDGETIATFHGIPGEEEGFWTPERIQSIDFLRCDECNTRRRRAKIFLVREDDGSIEQFGGTCAVHLNLAKIVDHHLRALKALRAFFDKMGGEESGGGRRRDQLVDPAWTLVLAQITIDQYGYTSGGAAYSNPSLTSTKSRVAYAMGLLNGSIRIGAKDDQMREDRRQIREQLAAFDTDRAEALYADAKVFVDAKRAAKVDEFSTNLHAAFVTGAIRLLGFMVWIPQGLRTEAERAAERAAREAARAARPVEFPYTPVLPTTGAELATYLETWFAHVEDAGATLCADLGLNESSLRRALSRPDKALTKTLGKKLARHVPGTWTVTRLGSWTDHFSGQTVYFLTCTRNDGAQVVWKTSSPYADGERVNQDDTLRFLGVTVGDIPPPRDHKGKTYQDGRKINRVTACVVPSPV